MLVSINHRGSSLYVRVTSQTRSSEWPDLKKGILFLRIHLKKKHWVDFYHYRPDVYTHCQHTFMFKQHVKVNLASDDPFNTHNTPPLFNLLSLTTLWSLNALLLNPTCPTANIPDSQLQSIRLTFLRQPLHGNTILITVLPSSSFLCSILFQKCSFWNVLLNIP